LHFKTLFDSISVSVSFAAACMYAVVHTTTLVTVAL